MNSLPASPDSAFAAFERAVALVGSQSEFARVIGCTPANIHQLLKARRPLSARFVIAAELATGIPRHELRPDIYPPEEHAPAARATAQQSAAHPSASIQSAPLAGQDADGSVPALDYAPSRDGADPLKGMAA